MVGSTCSFGAGWAGIPSGRVKDNGATMGILVSVFFLLVPPQVDVEVSVSAQLAAFDDAPVLPDDFASNDPARVSAKWEAAQKPAPIIQSPTVRRWSKSELEEWVRQRYTPTTALMRATVAAGSSVWAHLTRDHGFTSDQINGMQRWIAMALHDAAHPKIYRNGRKDPPLITSWKTVSAVSDNPQLTLFTADDSWRCGACEVQKRLLSEGDFLPYKIVRVPAEGSSPTGTVPCWKAPDGATIGGAFSARNLNPWARRHGAADQPVETPSPVVSVAIEGGTSGSVLAALAEHVRRQSTPDEIQPSEGLLPEIDADVDDGLIKLLDAMISPAGYENGAIRIRWPDGSKQLSFSPAVEIRFRKIVEIDVKLTGLRVDGREITLQLDGFPDLVVRLK